MKVSNLTSRRRCSEVFHRFQLMLPVFAADYPDGSNSSEYLVQPTTYLPENFTYAQNLPCPERLPSMSKSAGTRCQESHSRGEHTLTLLLSSHTQEGLVDVNMTEIPLEEVELKFSKFFGIEYGGRWKPQDCRPRWKVGPCTTTHVHPRVITHTPLI